MKGLSFRTGGKISRKLYHGLGPLEFVLGMPKLNRIHGANALRKKGQRRGEYPSSSNNPPLIPVTLPWSMEFRIGLGKARRNTI